MGILKLPEGIRKYRAAVLVVLLGVFLMAVPQKPKTPPPEPVEAGTRDLGSSLSEILSQMEGAGKVEVLLTENRGQETLYQQDEDPDLRRTTVLVTGAGREEQGLVRQVNPPRYQGAVILSQGADSSAVRLALSQAVARATGLSFDRITVLKMK